MGSLNSVYTFYMGFHRVMCSVCQRAVSVCALGGQAFKSYDEAGAVRRIQCLKYLVLATMLMESAVDPFDAQARLSCSCPSQGLGFRFS